MAFDTPREDLEQRFATGAISEYQAATLTARLRAFAKRRPPNAAAEKTSLADAYKMADDWLAANDRALPHDDSASRRGTVAGVLAGRAPHHIVIDTGEALVALRSDTIATPKRQQFDEEISFDLRSPIEVQFDSRGNGLALQSRDRDDVDFALLKLAGMRYAASRNEDALLMVDDNYRGSYDLTGTVIATRGDLAAVYDTGAVLAILDDAGAAIGETIRRGPRANAQALARGR